MTALFAVTLRVFGDVRSAVSLSPVADTDLQRRGDQIVDDRHRAGAAGSASSLQPANMHFRILRNRPLPVIYPMKSSSSFESHSVLFLDPWRMDRYPWFICLISLFKTIPLCFVSDYHKMDRYLLCIRFTSP